MTERQGFAGAGGAFARLRRRLSFLSLYPRIVIGNTVIIVMGAVGGTLLTRRLSEQADSLWLMVFFAVAGTGMSILLNNWIVKKSLQPLNELHRLVARVAAGKTPIETERYEALGPDFQQLSTALNAIVRQLEERNQQLRALSERAIRVQEEERMRIARSLHDDTGQSLSSLILQLDRLESRLPEQPPELQERLAAAREVAAGTLAELRKIIFDLRPTILDDLGLAPAIRWYARTYLEAEGVQVRLYLPEEELRLPVECSTTLFRICQEAMSNILRHASAKMVMITLCHDGREVCLQVIDDGQGFDMKDLSEQGPYPQKLGLLGIKERAELVGGRVTVETAPGQGVRLQVCLPAPGCEGSGLTNE